LILQIHIPRRSDRFAHTIGKGEPSKIDHGQVASYSAAWQIPELVPGQIFFDGTTIGGRAITPMQSAPKEALICLPFINYSTFFLFPHLVTITEYSYDE
jgi:hypothetical protein